MSKFWQKAIILVDMNAFFASIEQLDFPELRGQPVAVTNGREGTCIITASYEARKFGIKTGVRVKEAKQLCPHLRICPSRPKRYAEISANIMRALKENITPDIEVFSVDEAFLDVTNCQELFGHPEVIAKKVKKLVQQVSGVPCSIGLSGDKTTAKFAAKLKKPNGLTVIHPDDAEQVLASVPVTELCGIAWGIGRFLEKYGVLVCGDMKKLPISILAKRFGNLGRRIWYMCQGADPEPVLINQQPMKTLGHGKVMPPNTKDEVLVKTYLRHMCEKVAYRLRNNELEAQLFFIGFKRQQTREWFGKKIQLALPTHHGDTIYQEGLSLLKTYWRGEGLCQLQVTALDPKPEHQQLQLCFSAENEDEKRLRTNQVDLLIDQINKRFGNYTIANATLLNRSSMNDVIAPAWRPEGSRRSV